MDFSSPSESALASSDENFALLVAAQGITDPAAQAAVREGLRVLHAFVAAFNARDAQRWSRTLNYPHVRITAGQVQLWQTPEDYAASNDIGELAKGGWSYTRWDWIRPVQADAEKAHFALQFTRYDAQDKPLQTFQALYVVTRHEGHWGVQARSSYAGILVPGAAF